jgi:probable transposase
MEFTGRTAGPVQRAGELVRISRFAMVISDELAQDFNRGGSTSTCTMSASTFSLTFHHRHRPLNPSVSRAGPAWAISSLTISFATVSGSCQEMPSPPSCDLPAPALLSSVQKDIAKSQAPGAHGQAPKRKDVALAGRRQSKCSSYHRSALSCLGSVLRRRHKEAADIPQAQEIPIVHPQAMRIQSTWTWAHQDSWPELSVQSKPPTERRNQDSTVRRDALRDIHISFLCDQVAQPEQAPKTGLTAGADFGLKDFVTLSTGEKIAAPQPLKAELRYLRKAQRVLSRKQKGLKARKRADWMSRASTRKLPISATIGNGSRLKCWSWYLTRLCSRH